MIMKSLPLTTNREYNNPIKIYNNFLKHRGLKQADNFKNLRSYFAYLTFEKKKSVSVLRFHKFALLKSIQNHYLDKNDYNKVAIYKEFFARSFNYKIRPAILNIDSIPTLQDMAKLLSHCTRREFALVFFVYLSGMRNFEVRKILLSDCTISRDKKRVTIGIKGKNQKKRVLSIPYKLYKLILREYNPVEYLFETRDHKKISGSTLRFIIEQVAKRANIDRRITPKLLRITILNHIYKVNPNMPSDFMSERFGHTEKTREYWYKLFTNSNSKHLETVEKKIVNLLSNKRLLA